MTSTAPTFPLNLSTDALIAALALNDWLDVERIVEGRMYFCAEPCDARGVSDAHLSDDMLGRSLLCLYDSPAASSSLKMTLAYHLVD
jgi:hypothetical protein